MKIQCRYILGIATANTLTTFQFDCFSFLSDPALSLTVEMANRAVITDLSAPRLTSKLHKAVMLAVSLLYHLESNQALSALQADANVNRLAQDA